jgi:hypothetical protein
MAVTSLETQPRASKAAAYFGMVGVVFTGLTALGIVLAAPLTLPGLALIGAGVAMAATDRGRGIAKKIGHQVAELAGDCVTHMSQDLGRFSNWWRRVTAPQPAQPPVLPPVLPPVAKPETGTTLTTGASLPGFNQAAKPAAETPAATPAAAPQPPAPPKPGA